ncbi:MAG TPA: hypothetical protein VF785_04330 [Gemmatimonadaceae bacterium]
MTISDDHPTQRREFLGQIAASAIVLAGAACATPIGTGQATTAPTPSPSPAPPSAPVHWDDSWFARLTAKHKAVFDSPEIDDGLAVDQASGYIRGMRDAAAAGQNDVQTVVVMRHQAIPMVFNDAMWAKYQLGKELKVKDYPSEKWATRNPFASADPTAKRAATDRPQPNLAWLASHGHILLGCDLATRGYAGIIADRTKADSHVVYEELKANLVPGVILQPTGVYAVHRAQEAGCTYIRST